MRFELDEKNIGESWTSMTEESLSSDRNERNNEAYFSRSAIIDTARTPSEHEAKRLQRIAILALRTITSCTALNESCSCLSNSKNQEQVTELGSAAWE